MQISEPELTSLSSEDWGLFSVLESSRKLTARLKASSVHAQRTTKCPGSDAKRFIRCLAVDVLPISVFLVGTHDENRFQRIKEEVELSKKRKSTFPFGCSERI